VWVCGFIVERLRPALPALPCRLGYEETRLSLSVSGFPLLRVCYERRPLFVSPTRIPALIAVIIPRITPLAFAVVFAALSGIGGRFGIIASADLGAYISRLCSAVSFGASGVGVGSVFTLTFCAAIIARVLFALGICSLSAVVAVCCVAGVASPTICG